MQQKVNGSVTKKKKEKKPTYEKKFRHSKVEKCKINRKK